MPATPPTRSVEPRGMPSPSSSSSFEIPVLQRFCLRSAVFALEGHARREHLDPARVMTNVCSSRLCAMPRILTTCMNR